MSFSTKIIEFDASEEKKEEGEITKIHVQVRGTKNSKSHRVGDPKKNMIREGSTIIR